MKQLTKIFNKSEIRCFVKNNEPYFSATDVCRLLGLKNTSRAISSLSKDDVTTSNVIDSIGRNQEIYIINES